MGYTPDKYNRRFRYKKQSSRMDAWRAEFSGRTPLIPQNKPRALPKDSPVCKRNLCPVLCNLHRIPNHATGHTLPPGAYKKAGKGVREL